MRWIQQVRMSLLTLFRRRSEKARLQEELSFHLEQQVAENVAGGMEPEEARFAALRLFGNPTLLDEEARSSWSWNWLEAFWRDIRYGMRTLWRAPGFAHDGNSRYGAGNRSDDLFVHHRPLCAVAAIAIS